MKRKLVACVKQRAWDEETINELNAQVSRLRARLKFITAKKGAALYVKDASISHQRITSTRLTSPKKSRNCLQTITIHLQDGTVTQRMKTQSPVT